MVTDLGQRKWKPNCLQGGVPTPASEHWKGTGIEALSLLKFRERVYRSETENGIYTYTKSN